MSDKISVEEIAKRANAPVSVAITVIGGLLKTAVTEATQISKEAAGLAVLLVSTINNRDEK
jgi:hypothetical protein